MAERSADGEQAFILSRIAPSRVQTLLAIGTVLLLLLVSLLVLGPFSHVHTARIDAFVPAYLAAIVIIDFITAVILYAQYSILRLRALLVLASGYLFTTLVSAVYLITFPQLFYLPAVLGLNLQFDFNIYMLWHVGFPLFVTAYALLGYADDGRLQRKGAVATEIFWSSAATAALVVCAVAFLAYLAKTESARNGVDGIHYTSLVAQGRPHIIIVSTVVAICVLWIRRRSLLDLWLLVVVWAYLSELFFIWGPFAARFSFGWYVASIFMLISAALMLYVLLYEITVLYGNMLGALLAQRREREARILTGDAIAASIAHEVKQPLTSIIFNAQAGVRWLDRKEPDLAEATTALNDIVSTSHRVATLIESIRAVFKRGELSSSSFDSNDLIQEVLRLLRADLEEKRIGVHVDVAPQAAQIVADRVQLLQVLINLTRNAIESMAGSDGPRQITIRVTVQHDGTVLFCIDDTGPGLGDMDSDRIFNPLFTTKPGGMGMGLSICRSIIEAHQGRIWVDRSAPSGAAFFFTIGAGHALSDAPIVSTDDSVEPID